MKKFTHLIMRNFLLICVLLLSAEASGQALIYSENFQSWTADNVFAKVEKSVTSTGRIWKYYNMTIVPTQAANGSGSMGAVVFNSSESEFTLPVVATGGIGKVSINAKSNTSASVTLRLLKKSAVLPDWTLVSEIIYAGSTAAQTQSFILNETNDNVEMKIVTGGTARSNLFDVMVYDRPAVTWTNPEGGTLIVKEGTRTLTSGEKVNCDAVLSVTAVPNSGYAFVNMSDGSKTYLTSTMEVTASKDLRLSATFISASQPTIITPSDVVNMGACVIGESLSGSILVKATGLTNDLNVSFTGLVAGEFSTIMAIISKDLAMSTEGVNLSFKYTPVKLGLCSVTMSIQGENGTLVKNITLNATSKLAVPMLSEVSDLTHNNFTINWSPVAGADSYEVHVSKEAYSDQANLVFNSGFEDDYVGDWILSGTAAKSDVVKKNGLYSIFMDGSTTNKINQHVPVIEGSLITIKYNCFINAVNTGNNGIRMWGQWLDANGTALATTAGARHSDFIITTNQWNEKVLADVAVPAGAAYLDVDVRATPGTVAYIEDVSVIGKGNEYYPIAGSPFKGINTLSHLVDGVEQNQKYLYTVTAVKDGEKNRSTPARVQTLIPTGIDTAKDADFVIKHSAAGFSLVNAKSGSTASVYNELGLLVDSRLIVDGAAEFSLKSGIYIIKVDSKVLKFIF